MKNKLFAAVDVGTNTFRLLIAGVCYDRRKKNYTLKNIFSERIVTRLGSGISRNGILSEEAITTSIAALVRFSNILSTYQVHKISAVATSALREARNRDEFVRRTKAEAGLSIKIISGKQEAKTTASGMLMDIPVPEAALMADIGGGSTELIFSRRGKPLFVDSLGLGVVYLAGKYMRHDPPLKEDLTRMERYISRKIGELEKHYLRFIPYDAGGKTVFIGTAGTVTTLAAVSHKLRDFEHGRIHNTRLTLKKVKDIFSFIAPASSRERAGLIPFEPSRLDIIVPGTLILIKLMEFFSFREIIVSNYGLREGVLIDLYRKNEKKEFG